MIKRAMSGYVACLMAVVPISAITAASGCSGQSPEGDDEVSKETASVTNNGATDPGPRPGPAGAGAPLTTQPIDPDSRYARAQAASACFPGLSPAVQTFCEQAVIRFQQINSVSGATVSTGVPGFIAAGTVESGVGLGPTFNNLGCTICHSQPSVLGAGVAPSSPQFPGQANPAIAVATLDGAKNTVPSFLTAAGPLREARFTTDGNVHDLFTIAGRSDASGCNALQPPFATALAAGQVSFRIPIALFGDGLVEIVPDAVLMANLAQAQGNTQFNTGGTFNLSANDGTITRFGWKAQNRSLTVFAAEALNVELGVSNPGFPYDRAGGASNLQGCFGFNAYPEDNTKIEGSGANTVSDVSSNMVNLAAAISLSAPALPSTAQIPESACDIRVFGSCADAAVQGSNQFVNIGCANCHTPQFTSAESSFDPAMSNVTFHPFSDFALHNMGTGLADGITQGNAGPQQFRTAPLWGVGQRLFFLHDGRTNDLTAAILAHASTGSDATTVIANFNNLSRSDQQAILVFLRSL
jgi:CxxC motif-containing protein (DUF1111 family)